MLELFKQLMERRENDDIRIEVEDMIAIRQSEELAQSETLDRGACFNKRVLKKPRLQIRDLEVG